MPDLAGQIGLVPHAKTLVEWLIQLVTRSKTHHAILAISETECVSCEPAGALIRPISRFPDAYWSHFDLGPGQVTAITSWGRQHVGAPYGWFADAVIGVALLFGVHTPGWLERWLNNGKHFECAQFCDAAYVASDIHLFQDGRPPGEVYPGSFEHIWRAHGWMPR